MSAPEDPSHSTNSQSLRLAAANALIRNRRSIKPDRMSERPVETWILGNLLENANWAPSHGQTEPWRFKIFEGEAREKLADVLEDVCRSSTPPAKLRDEVLDKLRAKVLRAPVVLIIWMKRQPSETIPEVEELCSVACAVQNLHLSASAVGLAGYWSSPAFVYSEEMKRAFQLEPADRCLGLFYLGWPEDPDDWPEGTRKPIQDKIEWHDES